MKKHKCISTEEKIYFDEIDGDVIRVKFGKKSPEFNMSDIIRFFQMQGYHINKIYNNECCGDYMIMTDCGY